MASIANDPGGRKRILFRDPAGERKTIWLGKISRRSAEEIKTRVETINTAAIAGHAYETETARWLSKIGDELHGKLAKVGLVASRQPLADCQQLLGPFLKSYIDGRTDLKGRSLINLQWTADRLLERFGANRPLQDVTEGDADDWAIWLRSEFAPATAGRSINRAKQFFRAAVRRRVIDRNPFTDVKAPSQVNDTRKAFVARETIEAVLAACPNLEWQLLFALSRYAGLRCPSEHLALTLPDILWDKNRIRVPSPKTQHHEGKGERYVPIFPELRPYLEKAFDQAEPGAIDKVSRRGYLIRRYCDRDGNLRTQALRILARAGVTPWPKLFHNLRASCETELAKVYPIHVVCRWMGHAALIAQKHYLQVTDQDFDLAADPNSASHIAHAPKTSQNPSQHRAAPDAHEMEETAVLSRFLEKSPVFSGDSRYPRQDSNLHKLA
jgi:integrase